jgi:hypothetical protein
MGTCCCCCDDRNDIPEEIEDAVKLVQKGRYEDALELFQEYIEDHAAMKRTMKYLDWKRRQTVCEARHG